MIGCGNNATFCRSDFWGEAFMNDCPVLCDTCRYCGAVRDPWKECEVFFPRDCRDPVIGEAVSTSCPGLCNNCDPQPAPSAAEQGVVIAAVAAARAPAIGDVSDAAERAVPVKPPHLCPTPRHQWAFNGKCYYTLRCRGGLTERLPADDPVKCNCNFRDARGVLNTDCHRCVVYAGAANESSVDTLGHPKMFSVLPGKRRFDRFKTPAIQGVQEGWFKCLACRNGMIFSEGQCVAPATCAAKPGFAVYAPKSKQAGGRCTKSFDCNEGTRVYRQAGPQSSKCICPTQMGRGCATCRYSVGWQDTGGNDEGAAASKSLAGPICIKCRPGYFFALERNYKAVADASRYGIGKCVSAKGCSRIGGLPSHHGRCVLPGSKIILQTDVRA